MISCENIAQVIRGMRMDKEMNTVLAVFMSSPINSLSNNCAIMPEHA